MGTTSLSLQRISTMLSRGFSVLFCAAAFAAQVRAQGGDFEFKCETTCQLVKKVSASAAASSFMELEQETQFLRSENERLSNKLDAIHRGDTSFLETASQQTGGDFEFKCETTCQLVKKVSAGAAAAAGGSGPSLSAMQNTGMPPMPRVGATIDPSQVKTTVRMAGEDSFEAGYSKYLQSNPEMALLEEKSVLLKDNQKLVNAIAAKGYQA